MNPSPPCLEITEWSRTGPEQAPWLRNLTLTAADRRLLDALAARSSLRVEELRHGLQVEVGPHVGSVSLSALRIDVRPKLALDAVLAMAAYGFRLRDLVLTEGGGRHPAATRGFVDLLGLALLSLTRRLARGGLLRLYREQDAELASPRGRIMAAWATPGRLRCRYAEPAVDHPLHQALAGGLWLAARLVADPALASRLRHAATGLSLSRPPGPPTAELLRRARALLDRRSGHYRDALTLTVLLSQGCRLGSYTGAGPLPLGGFLLDMNRLFEGFLTRWLSNHAPPGLRVAAQRGWTDAFVWLDNPAGWRGPVLRPDLVFLRGNQVLAVGDAKYRDHASRPPSTAELYQLTAYGLAYPLAEPGEVLLFYPLAPDAVERPARLYFAPAGSGVRLIIRLVGVPVAALLNGREVNWWPLGAAMPRECISD